MKIRYENADLLIGEENDSFHFLFDASHFYTDTRKNHKQEVANPVKGYCFYSSGVKRNVSHLYFTGLSIFNSEEIAIFLEENIL